VECDQPTHHRRDDERPDIQVDDRGDQLDDRDGERVHPRLAPGSGPAMAGKLYPVDAGGATVPPAPIRLRSGSRRRYSAGFARWMALPSPRSRVWRNSSVTWESWCVSKCAAIALRKP